MGSNKQSDSKPLNYSFAGLRVGKWKFGLNWYLHTDNDYKLIRLFLIGLIPIMGLLVCSHDISFSSILKEIFNEL